MWKWLKKFIYDIGQALFWQPIRNGNGLVLNTEFASYTTVLVVFFAIITEAVKDGQQFTDVQFIAILGLLAGILGIKEYFNNKHKNEE